jgi:hypothetical protein
MVFHQVYKQVLGDGVVALDIGMGVISRTDNLSDIIDESDSCLVGKKL